MHIKHTPAPASTLKAGLLVSALSQTQPPLHSFQAPTAPLPTHTRLTTCSDVCCRAVQKNSRERYIFFSFPHVAVDSSGGLGSIQRPGREACSSACGALKAALGHFQGQGVTGTAGGELFPPIPGCCLQHALGWASLMCASASGCR